MKHIYLSLLAITLFMGCAATYRYPDTPQPKMDGGEIVRYRFEGSGEAVVLFPENGSREDALRFKSGAQLSVRTGILTDPETRVSGNFSFEDKVTGEKLSILASARYPEAFFSEGHDDLVRANGDFALLDGEIPRGLLSYDLSRTTNQSFGEMEGWKYTCGVERGSEGVVLRDKIGVVARIAMNRTRITTQYRPGTSDSEMRRAMKAFLLTRMLSRFVLSQRPNRVDIPDRTVPWITWPPVQIGSR
ncbi:hypothetical protein KQI63_08530 [bacterium]|nr:hypothetical protein [bacterium]